MIDDYCKSHRRSEIKTPRGWRIRRLACELPVNHKGKHEYAGISWRERDSDEYKLRNASMT